ncbi:MAG: hypothetical protein IKF56_04940 [Eggerthellaceae bacterium]|nr:hypothetical protein [Eggerthellaceae bacterium]
MANISKKQRVALRQIDELRAQNKRDIILGVASIIVMVAIIVTYNTLTYTYGIIDESNTILRAVIYAIAMVIAGFCGIMFMRASRRRAKVDGLRQSTGISRDTLDAWNRGEIEK